jgi:hypothetical protein
VNPVLGFILGSIMIGLAICMLSERTSSRIRHSRFWFFGSLTYLLMLSLGGKLVLPLFVVYRGRTMTPS